MRRTNLGWRLGPLYHQVHREGGRGEGEGGRGQGKGGKGRGEGRGGESFTSVVKPGVQGWRPSVERCVSYCARLQCVAAATSEPAPPPWPLQVEEEVESQCLRQLSAALPGRQFVEAVNKINSNVAYSGLNYAVTQDGLFVENKEKLINAALTALISKEGELP